MEYKALSLYIGKSTTTENGQKIVVNSAVFTFKNFPHKIDFMLGTYFKIPRENVFFSVSIEIYDKDNNSIDQGSRYQKPTYLEAFSDNSEGRVLHMLFDPLDFILPCAGIYKIIVAIKIDDDVIVDKMECYFIAAENWERI